VISPHSDSWMSKSRVRKVVSHYRQSAVPVSGIAPDCGMLPVPGAIELVSTLRSTGARLGRADGRALRDAASPRFGGSRRGGRQGCPALA